MKNILIKLCLWYLKRNGYSEFAMQILSPILPMYTETFTLNEIYAQVNYMKSHGFPDQEYRKSVTLERLSEELKQYMQYNEHLARGKDIECFATLKIAVKKG